MISIKSSKEIELMKHAGHINYLTHEEVRRHLKPGITTKELNDIADKFIRAHDCTPSFLNFDGYPGSICISINDEIVHGIPGKRKIKNGDVVSVDIGSCYKGYHSDSANTYIVGNAPKEVQDLVTNTQKSLYKGLSVIKEGTKINEIGAAIEKYAHAHNLSVVEELVGHGVGTSVHEDPDVPNYGKYNTGMILKTGMVIAVEPMLTAGSRHICVLDDDWTIVTEDGNPSAHYEHTVVVTNDGYEILTGE